MFKAEKEEDNADKERYVEKEFAVVEGMERADRLEGNDFRQNHEQ